MLILTPGRTLSQRKFPRFMWVSSGVYSFRPFFLNCLQFSTVNNTYKSLRGVGKLTTVRDSIIPILLISKDDTLFGYVLNQFYIRHTFLVITSFLDSLIPKSRDLHVAHNTT